VLTAIDFTAAGTGYNDVTDEVVATTTNSTHGTGLTCKITIAGGVLTHITIETAGKGYEVLSLLRACQPMSFCLARPPAAWSTLRRTSRSALPDARKAAYRGDSTGPGRPGVSVYTRSYCCGSTTETGDQSSLCRTFLESISNPAV
jgi:hypothetical protein